MQITLINFLWVAVLVLPLSLGLMMLVRKRLGVEYLRDNHPVSDPMVAVMGMLFAILLGFVLANSMDRFEQSRTTVRDEAGAVGDVLRMAEGLPKGLRARVHNRCLRYVDSVVDDEWPNMQSDKMSPRAQGFFNEIWHEIIVFAPQTQGESNIHQSTIDALKVASECRRTRTAQLTYRIPLNLCLVVLLGAITTVVFTYFLAVENLRVQFFMTSVVTLVICLNIYMLFGYDAPYSGDISISPAPFESIRAVFKPMEEPAPSSP